MNDQDKRRGLYGKYRVERVDGKHRGPYFVLDVGHDPYAANAALAYADVVEREYPRLAQDLRDLVQAHRPRGSGRRSYVTPPEGPS